MQKQQQQQQRKKTKNPRVSLGKEEADDVENAPPQYTNTYKHANQSYTMREDVPKAAPLLLKKIPKIPASVWKTPPKGKSQRMNMRNEYANQENEEVCIR